MLIPVYLLSAVCITFGVLYAQVLNGLIKPVLGETSFAGWRLSVLTSLIYAAVLILAATDHYYGTRKSGSALKSADHICSTPGIITIFGLAEKGHFDPYNWIMTAMGGFSYVCMSIEHGVSWFYDKGVPGLTKRAGNVLHRFDNGHLSRYLSLAVSGLAFIALLFLLILFKK